MNVWSQSWVKNKCKIVPHLYEANLRKVLVKMGSRIDSLTPDLAKWRGSGAGLTESIGGRNFSVFTP